MYVTRPLSLYRASPGAAAETPPEGPHSGYLVTQDEEYEAQATCCLGLCNNPYLGNLPFPQNRVLTVEYTVSTGTVVIVYNDEVLFFPVPGQPLSSNRYYVVRVNGKHAGKVCTCSREEDKRTSCFCSCVKDVKPRPFDQADVYQQVEVVPYRGCCGGGFYARAVDPDGFPPEFLRRKGWRIHTSQPRSLKLDLGAASGVDGALRARMPDTSFPISSQTSPAVVVGKWYCPFVFVKEDECPPKEQMNSSVFYEVTLEQFWEAIYTCENTTGKLGGTVHVSAGARRESALLRGRDPVAEELPVADGVVWFRPAKAAGGGVGVSAAVVERMRWEEERGGWEAGKGAVQRVERMRWEEERGGWQAGKGAVERVERVEYGGAGWGRFGCYVMVERFAVRRMDGSMVLAFDFRHLGKIITKWE